MTIIRRHLIMTGALALAGASLAGTAIATAESADETSVGQAVEALRKAMIDADKAKLDSLVADQLSYGHSDGHLQNKAEFIEVIADKKTVYKKIALTEPSLAIVGNNAIVRHVYTGESETAGKTSNAHIGVLQVWLKQEGHWKLLARQAVKI